MRKYGGKRPANDTARSRIEARIGKPLGPLATMPRDLRTALYNLALHMNKYRHENSA